MSCVICAFRCASLRAAHRLRFGCAHTRPEGRHMGLEFWAWLIVCVVLLGGEVLSPGLFMLPFGLGALSAAIASVAAEQPHVPWIAFIVVSSVLMMLFSDGWPDGGALARETATYAASSTASCSSEPLPGPGPLGGRDGSSSTTRRTYPSLTARSLPHDSLTPIPAVRQKCEREGVPCRTRSRVLTLQRPTQRPPEPARQPFGACGDARRARDVLRK